MAGIDDLKTDAGIQYILNKLKDTKSKEVTNNKDIEDNADSMANTPVDSADKPTVKSASELSKELIKPKQQIPDVVIDRIEDPTVNDKITKYNFTEESVLPWFTKSDRDLNNIHYIKFNDLGNIEYSSIKANGKAEDLATLKVSDDFVCEIDYYKSKHYVLFVKQLESNYPFSRVFKPCDESFSNDNCQEMEKVNSDNLSKEVMQSSNYLHYVVFTDLGIADFVVKEDSTIYPFGENDLNKWFEEISNYVQLTNTEYSPNKLVTGEDANIIRDFKYDIITMHRPGIITLDSIDNQDPEYQLHIKLKDEFSFLPMNRILGCLKMYSSSDGKSLDTFKRFLDRYFDIIV